jgi:excisionase family DNA binding protein
LYILRQGFLVFCPPSNERSGVADYVKIPELARRLDVSEKTARRYVQSGKLPSIFIGGAYRVSEHDLERFLEGARVEPGKAPRRSPYEPTFNDVLTAERRVVTGSAHLRGTGKLEAAGERIMGILKTYAAGEVSYEKAAEEVQEILAEVAA